MTIPNEPDDVIIATATCEFCDWSAQHTGGDGIEVATFLRRVCIEHMETAHADRLAPVEEPHR